MNRRWVVWVFGVVTGALAMLVLALALQPNCPTAGSCRPEYTDTWHGKVWKIKELIP